MKGAIVDFRPQSSHSITCIGHDESDNDMLVFLRRSTWCLPACLLAHNGFVKTLLQNVHLLSLAYIADLLSPP